MFFVPSEQRQSHIFLHSHARKIATAECQLLASAWSSTEESEITRRSHKGHMWHCWAGTESRVSLSLFVTTGEGWAGPRLEAGMAQHELGELGVEGGDERVQHVVAVQGRQVQQHLHGRRVQHAAQAAHPRRHQRLRQHIDLRAHPLVTSPPAILPPSSCATTRCVLVRRNAPRTWDAGGSGGGLKAVKEMNKRCR